MKRILLFIVAGWSLLHAQFAPVPQQAILGEVHGDHAVVALSGAAPGSSGIVLHKFDDRHSAIIATAIVTGSKEGKTSLRFQRYRRLRQKALPQYKIAPQQGDIVILGYLYNRVLPIVPDEAAYKRFLLGHRALDVIHPDLFASALYFDHTPQPAKRDFYKACVQNDLGLLYFAVDREGYFVDCESFRIVAREPLPEAIDAKRSMQPFYSRIPRIKNRLGGILSDESIGDYNRYYKKVLGIQK